MAVTRAAEGEDNVVGQLDLGTTSKKLSSVEALSFGWVESSGLQAPERRAGPEKRARQAVVVAVMAGAQLQRQVVAHIQAEIAQGVLRW